MTYFSFYDHDATQSGCMTSEFENKNIYINIYIKSSDQALAIRKRAFIGFSNWEISVILNDFYIGVITSLPYILLKKG